MTPLASESTRLLLPQRRLDERKSRYYALMLVGAAFLLSLVFGLFAGLYSSKAAAGTNESRYSTGALAPLTQALPEESSEARESEPSASHAAFELDEATLMLWDDWKAQTSKAKAWWDEERQKDDKGFTINMTSLRNHAQALGSHVDDERERFVNAAAENAQRFGDQVKDWWQNVQNITSAGTRVISDNFSGEKEEALEHNFQAWWEHASQVERSWWNSTVQQLQQEGGGWLDGLKQKGGAAAEKGRNWLDSSKSALKEDASATAEAERILWNKTKRTVHDDTSATERKFSLWWNTTKTVAQKGFNVTTEKEEEWWNATEHWFQDHVRQHHAAEKDLGAAAPRPLLYLNSTFAYSLLMNGYHWFDYSADFFLLQSGWDVQINQAYCGVASAAAVLNSLRFFVSLPVDPVYAPHPYATQLNLFDNNCVQKKVIYRNDTYDGILHVPGGLSLEQTKSLLECHLMKDDGWKVTAHHVDPETATVDEVRRKLAEALMNPAKRVIVNFDRRALGQDGGGHFSPLASYSTKEDSFLVMDVAKYKYMPVFVPAERLLKALATEDSCGDWYYPAAQDRLRDGLRPTTVKEYEKAMRKLGCRKMYRGYIIVEATSQEL